VRRHAERGTRLAALLLAALPAVARAQDDAVPLPPRIDRRPEPVLTTPGVPPEVPGPIPAPRIVLRPPNAATLAPLPEDRKNEPDEIVVVGKGWRLPDLGSAWRQRQKEAEETDQLHWTLLPLYDPNRPPQHDAPMLASPETNRQGYIELFRLRFGRRTRD
jgi:hypothetical protein